MDNIPLGLTYDDVLLIPQKSFIDHRSDVSSKTKLIWNFCGRRLLKIGNSRYSLGYQIPWSKHCETALRSWKTGCLAGAWRGKNHSCSRSYCEDFWPEYARQAPVFQSYGVRSHSVCSIGTKCQSQSWVISGHSAIVKLWKLHHLL